jgi:hypothetical protein
MMLIELSVTTATRWESRGRGGSIAIQNGWHDAIGSEALKWFFGGPSPHFEKMNYQSRFYSSYGTYNPFTNYRQ